MFEILCTLFHVQTCNIFRVQSHLFSKQSRCGEKYARLGIDTCVNSRMQYYHRCIRVIRTWCIILRTFLFRAALLDSIIIFNIRILMKTMYIIILSLKKDKN